MSGSDSLNIVSLVLEDNLTAQNLMEIGVTQEAFAIQLAKIPESSGQYKKMFQVMLNFLEIATEKEKKKEKDDMEKRDAELAHRLEQEEKDRVYVKSSADVERKAREKKVEKKIQPKKIASVNTCIILQNSPKEKYVVLIEQKHPKDGTECNFFGRKLVEDDAAKKLSEIASETLFTKSCRLFDIAPDFLDKKAFQSDSKVPDSALRHHVFTVRLGCDYPDRFEDDGVLLQNKKYFKNKSTIGVRLFNLDVFKNIKSDQSILYDTSGKGFKINKNVIKHISWFLAKKDIDKLELIETDHRMTCIATSNYDQLKAIEIASDDSDDYYHLYKF